MDSSIRIIAAVKSPQPQSFQTPHTLPAVVNVPNWETCNFFSVALKANQNTFLRLRNQSGDHAGP
jgi:hypothetical protein